MKDHKSSLPDSQQRAQEQAVLENAKESQYPSNAALVYDKIKAMGNKEMDRDAFALLLSAVAAGLSMGASLLVKGLLHIYLPEAPSSFLIESFAYTIGFIIVIMAKQQLFTENTVTAVVPVMSDPGLRSLWRLARLWGLVILGNLFGAFVMAMVLTYLPAFNPETHEAFIAAGEEVMQNSALEMFSRAILAGWLVATMVWILPNAKYSKVLIIILLTYIIQLGSFTHIIIGANEIFYLVLNQHAIWQEFLWPFAIPTLLGNIVGGTFIFTLLSHAQVRSDMQE